jgi:hypothetical protein
MGLPTVSICTVAMNRIHHVKKTLPVNLQQNNNAGVDFLLLDYNSDDGLADYVMANFQHELECGKLSYYRYNDADAFDRCHSRNLALKLADGEVVCNVDADNYAGPGFGQFVQEIFAREKNVCITGLDNKLKCDASGKLSVLKSDFINVSGYDENFEGYGFEDYDVVNRLLLNGCTAFTLNLPNFLNAIQHERQERLNNESAFRHFDSLYVHFIDPCTSQLLLLFSNALFVTAEVQNNFLKNCDDPQFVLNKNNRPRFQFSILNDWHRGSWSIQQNILHLLSANSEEVFHFEKINDQQSWKNTSRNFYRVVDHSMKLEAISFYTEIRNRQRMLNNVANKNIRPNREFGKGIVYKNFNNHQPIEI